MSRTDARFPNEMADPERVSQIWLAPPHDQEDHRLARNHDRNDYLQSNRIAHPAYRRTESVPPADNLWFETPGRGPCTRRFIDGAYRYGLLETATGFFHQT